MNVLRQTVIVLCIVIIEICCVLGGCAFYMAKKDEEKKQQEELIATYPEAIRAYLEEKYGREFCVNSTSGRSSGGSPIPFAQSDPDTYEYNAWEDEEDGYAFWTEVYPMSLKDKRILKIEDTYCWKFISRRIEEDLSERWKKITKEDTKICILPWNSIMFEKNIDENSRINKAIESMKPKTDIDIYIIFPPGIGLSNEELKLGAEKIAKDFYNEYVKGSQHGIEMSVFETDTIEDFLKIELEKTEQYRSEAKISEYEDKHWFPVEMNFKIEVQIKSEH